MRSIKWLVSFVVAGTAAAALAAGCGGDDNSVTPTTDASADHTTDQGTAEAASETGPVDSAMEAAACNPDAEANLTMLPVPDASLGGGATAASCLMCIKTTCMTQFAACNSDCPCNVNTQALLGCVAMPGMNLATCGSALAASGNEDAATLALTACIEGSALGGTGAGCLNECGLGMGNGDAAPPDGSTEDGGTDGETPDGASAEASTDGASGEAAATDAASE
jgi:hypothetical protein